MYGDCKEILVEKLDKVLSIKFNNPAKKNCLNPQSYAEIGRTLRRVANDDSITVVVLSGVGDYFTSGNDLTPSGQVDDFDVALKQRLSTLKELISSAIDCPKLLIAVVNGPAIGIGATFAALCDIIWCSKSAYFLTPFTRLGLAPEACSSYLFPLILGKSKAAEMLLLSEKMSAEEAYHFHFASKVFNNDEIDTVIWPKIKEISELPPNSLRNSKQLIKRNHNESLYNAFAAESEALSNCFRSEEFINAVMQFVSRKKKAKL